MFTLLKPLMLGLMLVGTGISWAHAQEPLSPMHDNACFKCHKKNGKMLGVHANVALDISCNDCHGEKQGHPRQPSELVIFNSDKSTSLQQTSRCLTCHEASVIGEQEWTHNVHSNKIDCAKCHQLHPNIDPMVAISAQQRAELCSSCHQTSAE